MELVEKEKSEPRFTIEAYYKSFRVLLTHPFESGGAIVGLIDKMIENGFTPEKIIYQAEKEPPKEIESHICPIHNVEMRKWEKENKVWYSHKMNGSWCTGKQK